jgi:hypothetical protein
VIALSKSCEINFKFIVAFGVKLMSISKESVYLSSRDKIFTEIYLWAQAAGESAIELTAVIEGVYGGDKQLFITPFGKLIRAAMINRISKLSVIRAIRHKPRGARTQTVHQIPEGIMAERGSPSTVQKLDSRTKLRGLKGRQFISVVQGGTFSSK